MRILCDHKIILKLKEKFYNITVRPVFLILLADPSTRVRKTIICIFKLMDNILCCAMHSYSDIALFRELMEDGAPYLKEILFCLFYNNSYTEIMITRY